MAYHQEEDVEGFCFLQNLLMPLGDALNGCSVADYEAAKGLPPSSSSRNTREPLTSAAKEE